MHVYDVCTILLHVLTNRCVYNVLGTCTIVYDVYTTYVLYSKLHVLTNRCVYVVLGTFPHPSPHFPHCRCNPSILIINLGFFIAF